MRVIRFFVILFVFAAPVAALSDLRDGDLPNTSKWYIHADFEEMRTSSAGQHLYAWLQDEVFDDIRDEAGVDLDEEADFLTAFATQDDGIVLIIEGDISQASKDKAMAIGAASGSMDQRGSGNQIYFHIKDDDIELDDGDIEIDMESFDDGAYFSFAIDGMLIVTSTAERMQSLLADKGKVQGVRGDKGDLFILRAEQSLIQAGASTEQIVGSDDWDSNILRNTKQAAVLIADKAGKLAFEAQLVTTEAEMATSLASIARGLISLQSFNDDIEPEVADVLRSIAVVAEDNRLTVSVTLNPETVVAALD